MELLTDDLILRTVTRADIDEIARMWNFFQGGVSVEEAHGALEYMNSQPCPQPERSSSPPVPRLLQEERSCADMRLVRS